MYIISKEFKFDAAHRLVDGYVGKCANIHGHEWRIKICLSSANLDQRGFVKDFEELTPIKEWIDKKLDHGMLVANYDTEMLQFLRENNQKHYEMPNNPTSENLASLVCRLFKADLPISSVTVKETCTCEATYYDPKFE